MKLNYIKKSILGIISAFSISLIIIYIFNIPLHEITAFTIQLLLLSLTISLIRLISQAARFYILVRLFSCIDFKFSESILMRGSSEFLLLRRYLSLQMKRQEYLFLLLLQTLLKPLGLYVFW
jgi:hypothetical protein